jgi:hypothetical protein
MLVVPVVEEDAPRNRVRDGVEVDILESAGGIGSASGKDRLRRLGGLRHHDRPAAEVAALEVEGVGPKFRFLFHDVIIPLRGGEVNGGG